MRQRTIFLLAYAVGLSGPFGSRSAVLMHVASASLLYLSHCGIWTLLYKDIAAVRACGLSCWSSAVCWSSCSQSCQMDHHLEMSKKNCEAQKARAARPCRSGEAGGLAHRLTPWWGSRDGPVWSDPRVGPVPSQTVRPAGLPSLVCKCLCRPGFCDLKGLVQWCCLRGTHRCSLQGIPQRDRGTHLLEGCRHVESQLTSLPSLVPHATATAGRLALRTFNYKLVRGIVNALVPHSIYMLVAIAEAGAWFRPIFRRGRVQERAYRPRR